MFYIALLYVGICIFAGFLLAFIEFVFNLYMSEASFRSLCGEFWDNFFIFSIEALIFLPEFFLVKIIRVFIMMFSVWCYVRAG
jgi:hypothetical protein